MLCKIIDSMTDVCISEENLFVKEQTYITNLTRGYSLCGPQGDFDDLQIEINIFSLVILNVHKQSWLLDTTNLKLVIPFGCKFLFSIKVGNSLILLEVLCNEEGCTFLSFQGTL